MKIKQLENANVDYLKITDLDNFFNVYIDDKFNYVFNLNASVYFDFDKSALNKYVLTHNAHWPVISYQIYGTTRFAWLLCKLNRVSTKDIFNMKYAGDEVYYLPKQTAQAIVLELNK